jgi:large subunit ribosomal protein L10
MAKTRKQKEQEVKEIEGSIKENDGFLAFGFNKAPVNDLNAFRSKIKKAGGFMKVVKRNLLDIALENNDLDFEPDKFLGQTGFVVFKDEISNVAGIVHDFINEDEKEGEFLGGYNLKTNEVFEPEYIAKVGQLPSREVLLGQVVGGISGPIRAFVYTLKAIAEKSN